MPLAAATLAVALLVAKAPEADCAAHGGETTVRARIAHQISRAEPGTRQAEPSSFVELEGRLAFLLPRYGEKHPRLLAAKAEMETVESSLRAAPPPHTDECDKTRAAFSAAILRLKEERLLYSQDSPLTLEIDSAEDVLLARQAALGRESWCAGKAAKR